MRQSVCTQIHCTLWDVVLILTAFTVLGAALTGIFAACSCLHVGTSVVGSSRCSF